MTTRPAVLDAHILDKLAQVVAIARHNGWGTQADVWRICDQHMRPRIAPNARAEAAEREVRALRARIDALTHDGKRVVELPRREADVLTLAADGLTRPAISEHLGITTHCVNNTLYRAAKRIGAVNGEQAVALVAARRIQITAQATRRKAA